MLCRWHLHHLGTWERKSFLQYLNHQQPSIRFTTDAESNCLQQKGIRAVFKSEITTLVRLKDALNPAKQDGVVYSIRCVCGSVYIGGTGRSMQKRIKEHERDIRLAKTQTYAFSEHAHSTGNRLL